MPTAASPHLDQAAQAATLTTRRWQERIRSAPLPLVIAICLLGAGIVIAVAAYLYTLSPPAFMDLDVYRKGDAAWWHGRDMYGTLPRTIAGNYLPFIYPPFAALAFAPLAALPWVPAAITLLALSVACLAVVIYLTVRRVWPTAEVRGAIMATALIGAAVIRIQPVWDTLWFGQINLVLMLLVGLDCLVLRPKWPRGMLIGIAAAIKLTPAVFVLYFLLRKDYRAAITSAITGAVATGIGFAISWSGSLKYWFGATGGARSISGSTFYTNQTIDGALARLVPRLHLVGHEKGALWLAGSAMLLVFAAAGIRRADRMGDIALAMAVTAGLGLLVSPTSWGHHWVYIVPALIAMAGQAVRTRRTGWWVATVCTAAVFYAAPFMWLPGNGAELHWRWWQQFPGNAYTIIGSLLILLFGAPTLIGALRTRFGRTAPAESAELSGSAGSVGSSEPAEPSEPVGSESAGGSTR